MLNIRSYILSATKLAIYFQTTKEYTGKYITVTRRPDGTLRLNFHPIKTDRGFSVVRYALGVSNELMWALEGLVEK